MYSYDTTTIKATIPKNLKFNNDVNNLRESHNNLE